jgi:hypothetical protein
MSGLDCLGSWTNRRGVFKEPQLMEIRRHIQLDKPAHHGRCSSDAQWQERAPDPKKPTYTESYDKWIPAGNRFESYMKSIPSPSPFVQPADTDLYEEQSSLIPRQRRCIEWVLPDSPAWSEGSLSPRWGFSLAHTAQLSCNATPLLSSHHSSVNSFHTWCINCKQKPRCVPATAAGD